MHELPSAYNNEPDSPRECDLLPLCQHNGRDIDPNGGAVAGSPFDAKRTVPENSEDSGRIAVKHTRACPHTSGNRRTSTVVVTSVFSQRFSALGRTTERPLLESRRVASSPFSFLSVTFETRVDGLVTQGRPAAQLRLSDRRL